MLPKMMLKVWDHLCEAYYGDSSYGSDVTEIYFYLLQARSPSYEMHLTKHGMQGLYEDSMSGKDWLREDQETARTFKELFLLFERHWNCTLSIEYGEADNFIPIKEWESEPFHRLHIKVDHDLSVTQEKRIRSFLEKYD